jgi:small subunit ribosomal protein S8
MSDPVADFLTRIRNAIKADHDDVLIPSSRLNVELARLLKEEGYIADYGVEQMRRKVGSRMSSVEFETLRVTLKYTEDREPVISGIKRISKPGRRQYATADELPRVLGGMGTAIITTSRGVMTAYEAKRQRVGGEVLAIVW